MGLELVRVTPPIVAGGYLAQRGLIAGTMNVFAPCGCVFTAASTGDTVLTLCQKLGYGFQWAYAIDALRDFEQLEESRHEQTDNRAAAFPRRDEGGEAPVQEASAEATKAVPADGCPMDVDNDGSEG